MKILVCGDAMVDRYWHGDIRRLSPEESVPIVAVRSSEDRAGGAANVANNIEAMGVAVERLFGGGDPIVKLRLLSLNQHVARIDFDQPQTPVDLEAYDKALAICDVVVLIDYAKGSLANAGQLIAMAKERDRVVLVDPTGLDYRKYRGADLIKPNQNEMREVLAGWHSQDELDRKMRTYMAYAGVGAILLTQAADGMRYYSRDAIYHVPAQANPVVDVSGAGEAVISAYAVGLAHRLSVEQRLAYSSKAAALCVGRFGTVTLTAQEVFG